MEIIVEGPSDRRFVQYLTKIPHKQITVARGIGNALKQLKNRKNNQKEAIAIVDADEGKTHPKSWYVKQNCRNTELSEKMKKMTVLLYLLWNMRLFVLSPDLERWILKVADINKIKPADFKLSTIHTELKRDLLDDSVSKQHHCEDFISALSSSEQFSSLKELLTGAC